jgi:hypothetical protein
MRFTIKLQLALAFGLIILLLLASTLFGINSLSTTNRDMNAMVDGPDQGRGPVDGGRQAQVASARRGLGAPDGHPRQGA